jgi:segregation and condensation protein B
MAKKKKQQAEETNQPPIHPEISDFHHATEEDVTTAELTSEEEVLEKMEEEDAEPDFDQEVSLFLQEEEESESFLPEASAEELAAAEEEDSSGDVALEGTELDRFESAEIEEVEFVEEERLESIVESILFASDRPVSLASLKLVFKGTNVKTDKIKRALDQLAVEYAGGRRGVTLEEVPGGYQLRTKIDNMEFLRRTLKARQFKLSGPALEVLSILAYKQPVVKAEIDEIRGVESGHLLRALMEKGLATFEGKSDLPGRPMLYATTKKFLEIFGLRNLKELPTLSQIDELLPEGIGEEAPVEKPTLSQITAAMSETVGNSYSQGEEELLKIQEQLEEISTSSQFFEEEKRRQQEKRDQEKAQNIREALALGEPVSNRDQNWLKRYDEALAAGTTNDFKDEEASVQTVTVPSEGENPELAQAVTAFDDESEEAQESEDELLFTAEADDIDEEGDTHA